MALDFPSSPTNGQVYTDLTTGNKYVYVAAYNYWSSEGSAAVGSAANTNVIFADGVDANGSAAFTFNKSTNAVTITNSVAVGSAVTVNAGGLYVNSATSDLFMNSSSGIWANGTFGTAGQGLTSNGSAIYWSSLGVNTAAQYTWSNTQTFNNTVATGNVTVTGFINVSSTGQFGGAVSGITTLAAGNTTVTGFVNASSTVTGSTLNIAADTNNRFGQGIAVLRSTSPTFYFRDTDGNVAMLHNNSNLLYVLRGATDTETWTAVSGEWPWYWDLTNNNSRCGGALNVVGDVTAFVSDIRLKKDVQQIDNALQRVMQIRGVRYRHNDMALELGLDDKDHVGVIAQEIEKVLPEVTVPAPFDTDPQGNSKSGENYKTVKYDKIVPLLIEAIKDLKAEIDSLNKKIELLSNSSTNGE